MNLLHTLCILMQVILKKIISKTYLAFFQHTTVINYLDLTCNHYHITKTFDCFNLVIKFMNSLSLNLNLVLKFKVKCSFKLFI